MTSEFQLDKLDRAFDRIDVNSNGQIERNDLIGLGSRLLLGFGQSPTSAKGQAVLAAWDAVWTELSDGEDALSPSEFRGAMVSAFIEGEKFDSTLLPLAQSVARLADTDGDGKVSAAEFHVMARAFGTSAADSRYAFSALADSQEALTVDDLVQALREYYTSPDPGARGNAVFGPL
jgi:Ca2+-binding EF-hand superfamily protein